MRRILLIGLAVSAALVLLVAGLRTAQVLAGASDEQPGHQVSSAPSTSAATTPARTWTVQEAGQAFLDDYVDPDGRVVRRDENGDTVSEGQAYAMLVAAALADRQRFTAVWTWTKEHLLRADGLLSWRWADGRVIDEESASDADLDAARALLVAAGIFDNGQFKAEGVRLATAVLDRETVMTKRGRILAAGSWATRHPYAYNPSYASPAANAVLAEATGDQRWAELDAGTRAVTTAMLDSADLPPDWAQVHASGRIEAMPGAAGHGNEGVRYGYDAARMPLRFAESCSSADVALAARLGVALDRFSGDPAVRDLGGAPLVEVESVVAASGKAAVLAAAGETERAGVQLSRAEQLQQAQPTYFGAAWTALGRMMLTTESLGGCPPL